MGKALIHVEDPFDPVWDCESKILILGSFPSVKSREQMFFYGHPRNRFWTVVSTLLKVEEPVTVDEKKAVLLNSHIALWDVIASCDIYGSSDSSIKNAVPNDIGFIIKNSKIKRIFTNGATADKLYKKYILPATGIEAVRLPSTSPANAAKSVDELVKEWAICTFVNDVRLKSKKIIEK